MPPGRLSIRESFVLLRLDIIKNITAEPLLLFLFRFLDVAEMGTHVTVAAVSTSNFPASVNSVVLLPIPERIVQPTVRTVAVDVARNASSRKPSHIPMSSETLFSMEHATAYSATHVRPVIAVLTERTAQTLVTLPSAVMTTQLIKTQEASSADIFTLKSLCRIRNEI